jgi:hypothetical protein
MYLNKSMENACEGKGLTTYILAMNKCPTNYGLLMGTHKSYLYESAGFGFL